MTPVDTVPDARGHFGPYGGMFVPETLVSALEELAREYDRAKNAQMKIVARVRAFDHHHEKIAPIVKITIADRRFEFVAVLFDPILQVDRRLDS